jgi:hypothetical protein
MNLTKALKHKKKLVKQADEFYSRFANYNSSEVDTTPSYDPKDMFEGWIKTTDELVSLKGKIHKANGPIAEKIFRLGEIKNLISRLRGIDTKEGKIRNRYSDNKDYVEYTAYVSLIQKDLLIKNYEEELEQLQEEIEAFNAITKI